MAVNRYDSPAQAEFINTYVPIPFEQLYTLGKEAKADVDKALKEYSTALDKWGEFQSPSEVDTKAWYDETYGRALPVAEEMAKNIDLIKTPEGRAKIYSVINNVDRAKLSMLKQSAENLKARQAIDAKLMMEGKYNPVWHTVDYTNYDTLSPDSGVFNDLAPLAYKSEVDLVKPFVDNLKASSLGTKGGYLMHGVSKDAVRKQVDRNISSILNTPEAQKHIQVLQNRGLSLEDATNTFVNSIYTAAEEFAWEDRSGVDAFALEAMRQQGELNKQRAKQGEANSQIPDTYARVYFDLSRKEADSLYNNPIFQNSRDVRAKGNEMLLQLENKYKPALAQGLITQEEFNARVKELYDHEASASKEYAKAYRDDMRNYFYSLTNIAPNVGVAKGNEGTYYNGASRMLDGITYNIPGQIVNAYNKSKSTAEVEIVDNGVPVKAYTSPSSKGLILSTDFVNSLMGVAPKEMKLMVKDNKGLQRNFAEDLKNGIFKNIIRIPQSTGMNTIVDGDNAIVQRVRIKIPKTALEQAGYDIDDFNNTLGVLSGNVDKKSFIFDWVASDRVGESNIGIKTQDGINTFTDTYYTFDVMEKMESEGTERLVWGQEANDIYGGSKMQNDQYTQTFLDSYESMFNY